MKPRTEHPEPSPAAIATVPAKNRWAAIKIIYGLNISLKGANTLPAHIYGLARKGKWRKAPSNFIVWQRNCHSFSIRLIMSDPYILHKLVLAPFHSNENNTIAADISALSKTERKQFVDFLLLNGLASFWSTFLHDSETADHFSDQELQRIKITSLANAAKYLMQKHVLDLITSLFNKESIPHAVFKGNHIREIIYENPSIRPAADIDVLVYPADLEKTVRILRESGFSLDIKEQNISHEVTLYFKNVAIDLHWHILRPGRLRISLTDEFLATRQRYPSHTGFNAETTLFIMLVHPVFTKYSTTYLASLVRMIDLVQWFETQSINWDVLIELLKKYRVCTAAWITTRYLKILTGETLPDSFVKQIEPAGVKRSYLNSWLQSDRASKLMQHPLAIQIGYTLPAHDSISDAGRFLRTLCKERYHSKQKTEDLLAATSTDRVSS